MRKKRTRGHIIADMSLHHVSYQVAEAGFTIEPVRSDYGYDGSIFTFNELGEVENGNIFIQLKATDSIDRYLTSRRFSFPVSRKDLDLWGKEVFPAYLVLFDAVGGVAYWVYVQKYLETNSIVPATIRARKISIKFDRMKIVNVVSVTSWRVDKQIY